MGSTIKQRLRRFNGTDYDTVHLETDGSVVEVLTYDFVLNTDSPVLGETVYFTAYPDIKWQVQHIDGDYAYLALAVMTEATTFGSSVTYSGSTIAQKCTDFLNNTIPNVADYLEEVTVNDVTSKVFIPSYDQLNGGWNWPSAGKTNRICQLNGSNVEYWNSTEYSYTAVWFVNTYGNFGAGNPAAAYGFRPAVKVNYKQTIPDGAIKDLNTALSNIDASNVVVTIREFVNPLNTDQLTLGQHDVYFKEYPDIKWCVDHLDGDYVYLGGYNINETTKFGSSSTYSGSTIAQKCTDYLNNTIPNVAQYLEDVTVNGVTNKVFIPSLKMFSGSSFSEDDANDPAFDYMSKSADNRIACYAALSSNNMWLSTPYGSQVWYVFETGGTFTGSKSSTYGFRPEVKVRYKVDPVITDLNTAINDINNKTIDASNVVVTEEFVNPLNTDQLTAGQHDVYFKEYPSIKWHVDHIDGDYAYLGLYTLTETTTFGPNSTYSGSTIAQKCTDFLNNTIPNVADYLEFVTVEGVTNKVFIPTYYQMSGQTGWTGRGDTSGPVFTYIANASVDTRKTIISNDWTQTPPTYGLWLSTAYNSNDACSVSFTGSFSYSPLWSAYGFRPEVKVRYKADPVRVIKDLNTAINNINNSIKTIDASNVLVTREFTNPLNTDQLTLGQTDVYFKAYPDIKWQVQHLDGDYVYLALYPITESTQFGSNTTYAGSTIAQKCTDYLNNTIPNVANYLEEVTVNGVTAKVFIPSKSMYESEWDWPKADASNRICQLDGYDGYWTSTAPDSYYDWYVNSSGSFNNSYPANRYGFRPAVIVRYKDNTIANLNASITKTKISSTSILGPTLHVASSDPTSSDGVDGDFWFVYGE